MARVNVYLPDDLVREAKEAKLNISSVTQEAIRARLARSRTRAWLESLKELEPIEISPEDVLHAVDEGRDELWGPEVWGPPR